MHEREGSSPISSEHWVAIATPLSVDELSGFCTRITLLLPPGLRIFSSAHSLSTSASAAGAVFVLRSASLHSLFAALVPTRYALPCGWVGVWVCVWVCGWVCGCVGVLVGG